MRKSIVIVNAFVVLMSFVIVGCNKEKSSDAQVPGETSDSASVTLSQASVKAIGLQSVVVSRKQSIRYTEIPAKVVANQDNEAIVGSLVPGRVCKVFVNSGDHVRAGQRLMLLEGMEIGAIKAGFITAHANYKYQKANYERQKRLLDENVGARKNLLESQNEFEKARAEYYAEKNRVRAVGLTDTEMTDTGDGSADGYGSGTLTITSPISGIIVERNVVIGQLIEATTTAFRIINFTTVWVDGQMYEKDVRNIGDHATVGFIASSLPGETFTGEVAYIGQLIDEKTRTITLRAKFDNAGGRLLPQMFGELKIPNANNPVAVTIPGEALVKIDDVNYVFVQKCDTIFEKRLVSIDYVHHEEVDVSNGLHDGETVVTKGAFYLKSELLKASFGEGE